MSDLPKAHVADELLAGQVIAWRKEVARLNDLIAHAVGAHVADERAAFEAWARTAGHTNFYRTAGKPARYDDLKLRGQWKSWQAARAAIPAGTNVPAGDLCFRSGKRDDKWQKLPNGTDPDLLRQQGYEVSRIAAGAPAETPQRAFDVFPDGEVYERAPAETLTASQIPAGAAVLGDDGQPIGRNTAIMVADAMRCRPGGTPELISKEWCQKMASREIEFDGNIEAGAETPKPDVHNLQRFNCSTQYLGMTTRAADGELVRFDHVVALLAAQPAPAPATDARDGERLDFLDKNGYSVGCNWKNTGFCGPDGHEWQAYIYGTGGKTTSYGTTIRQAVDAAMLSANSPTGAA